MKVRSSPYTVAIQEKTKQEQQNDFKKTEQHAVAGRARLHLHWKQAALHENLF